MVGKLTPHVFFNAAAGSANSSWYPLDYNNGSMANERSISGVKASAGDSEIVLEARTLVINNGVTAGDVIVTATSWGAAVVSFSAVLVGPFTHVRTRCVGPSVSAASVVGIL